MSDLRIEAVNDCFDMLYEAYDKEWKNHGIKRPKLSKIEDIAFVRKQKQWLFNRKRAIIRNIK